MGSREGAEYVLSIGDEHDKEARTERFRTVAELKERLRELERGSPIKFDVAQDLGPEKAWWKRLLGAKRRSALLFATEWSSGHARVVFYDEVTSEFWAINPEQGSSPSMEVRMQLSFLEPIPAPIDEVMQASRAFEAIREFLETGKRPSWLSYRHIR